MCCLPAYLIALLPSCLLCCVTAAGRQGGGAPVRAGRRHVGCRVQAARVERFPAVQRPQPGEWWSRSLSHRLVAAGAQPPRRIGSAAGYPFAAVAVAPSAAIAMTPAPPHPPPQPTLLRLLLRTAAAAVTTAASSTDDHDAAGAGDHHSLQDMSDAVYSTELGIYEPACGIMNCKFAFGHDEYAVSGGYVVGGGWVPCAAAAAALLVAGTAPPPPRPPAPTPLPLPSPPLPAACAILPWSSSRALACWSAAVHAHEA